MDHIGALTLNMPTKLYIDDYAGAGHYGFNNLPTREICGVGIPVPPGIEGLPQSPNKQCACILTYFRLKIELLRLSTFLRTLRIVPKVSS